jgi:hypothetical protein
VKSKDLVEETTNCAFLRKDPITRMMVIEMVTRVEAKIVEQIRFPRLSDGQPASARQSSPGWYQNRAPVPGRRGCLQFPPLSVWQVAACSVRIVTPLAQY